MFVSLERHGMLTGKQFEAIGRLTLGSNDLEAVIDTYLPYILQNPEWSVCLLMADKGQRFSEKIERFIKVLTAILEERPIAESQINSVIGLLAKAKQIAIKRNEYVHSVAYIDFRVNKRMIRNKKGTATIDENQILQLAEEAGYIAMHLSQECENLRSLLVTLRTSRIDATCVQGPQ
jgi:hypothetical protein